MEYLREDDGTQFSDRAWAQRLLQRASLSKRERLDVFYSAGGSYSSTAIEKALRHRCQRIHEEERKLPNPFRRTMPRLTARSLSSSAASTTTASSAPTPRFRKKGSGKGHGTHVAQPEDEELLEDEDED